MDDRTARNDGNGPVDEDGIEAPTTTEDALHLLADARGCREMAADFARDAPATAASHRDRAGRMERAAAAFLTLDSHPGTGAGGELAVPEEDRAVAWGLKDTLAHPDRVSANASRRRLDLLVDADCLDLGLDAAATARAGNSLERMLAHQMAAAHRMALRLMRRADRELARCHGQDATAEVNRLVNASARMMRAYQEGLLTLGRMRTGGRQVVQVVHQHVDARGGHVAVAGSVAGGGPGRDEGGGDGN